MADEQPRDDGGDEVERPERDRFGALVGRPWYRHPLFVITAAGIALFLLNWYVASNRSGAGVPLFGG
ncbi:MAG: hypothetical protein ACLFS9_04640 [Nitriliruptoraceae bacterium]